VTWVDKAVAPGGENLLGHSGHSGPGQAAVRGDRRGNLRAYVQGQDDVGHAALAN
jgi:hypothetical protein